MIDHSKSRKGKPRVARGARKADPPASQESEPKGPPTAVASPGDQQTVTAEISPATEDATEAKSPGNEIPVTGIGASAGGLEAFTQLLEHLPGDTGMAFVLVQHLSARHESVLSSLLAKTTRMPVAEVRDGMQIEANHVYVIPPDTNMVVSNGNLQLRPRPEPTGPLLSIDYFFSSLAADRKEKAIGVLLSGTASDGTEGLKAIKAEGGITFAQNEETARYPAMPAHAVAAGCVDFVLSPEDIAKELTRIARHPYLQRPAARLAVEPSLVGDSELFKIFAMLRNATSVDFSFYKPTTIKRRIERRLVLHRIPNLSKYLVYLHDHPQELDALYQDLLIHVTSFFRDRGAFEALRKKVFPALIKNRSPESDIRIWVPGCSTGEEAYSIAISLLEFLDEKRVNFAVKIFATDISEEALERARGGIYPANIPVSPERLRRYFLKSDRGYQVAKSVRDICVFARQNLTKDPPFSNLDLISCRNLLIFLGAAVQRRVLSFLHYALKPTGFLILGNSETVGEFTDHYSMLDRRHKIFGKKAVPLRVPLVFEEMPRERLATGQVRIEQAAKAFEVEKEADRVILGKYAPAGVLINDEMDILQFRGRVGPYLAPAGGTAKLHLLKMVSGELLYELRKAIHEAKKEKTPVRREGVPLNHGRKVNIEAVPIHDPTSRRAYYLILFGEGAKPEEAFPKKLKAGPAARKAEQRQAAQAQNRQAEQIGEELAATKAYLNSILEEYGATTEELRTANEEVLSGNEELQSTNEELETAKEELQSSNEELTTLNEELENRNNELGRLYNDLNNLLSSTNLPIVMLGADLRIRRFTPAAEKLLNLTQLDVGRPIGHLRLNVNVDDLEKLTTEVIDTVTTCEREIQDEDGRWYSLRIRPYRTTDNKIDGAVLTLVDINDLQSALVQVKQQAQLLDMASDAILACDLQHNILYWNHGAERLYGWTKEEALGKKAEELVHSVFPEPLESIREALFREERWTGEIRQRRRDGSQAIVTSRWTLQRDEQGDPTGWLEISSDITERMLTEEALKVTRERYRLLYERALAGVFRTSLDGRILESNDAMARILGLPSRDSLVSRQLSEFIADSADSGAFLEELRTEKLVMNHELNLRREDGEPIWVLANASFLESEKEGPVIEGVVTDISALKKAEAALSDLSGRLLHLQDEERRRLARELHDSTAQDLAAAEIYLGLVQDQSGGLSPAARQALGKCREVIDRATQEIRSLSYLLHPPLLDEVGLPSAIRWYVKGIEERSQLKVQLNVPEELPRMPQEVEMALFRVMQECMTNVHRHSGSETAEVHLGVSPGSVVLKVSDKGTGFSQKLLETPKGGRAEIGVGLPGMRERVKQLGGRLEVKTSPHGTTVTTTLPLPDGAAAVPSRSVIAAPPSPLGAGEKKPNNRRSKAIGGEQRGK